MCPFWGLLELINRDFLLSKILDTEVHIILSNIAFSPMKKKQKDLSYTSLPFSLDSVRGDFPFFFRFSLKCPSFMWDSY